MIRHIHPLPDAVIAQLAGRRPHNPKVVSSALTHCTCNKLDPGSSTLLQLEASAANKSPTACAHPGKINPYFLRAERFTLSASFMKGDLMEMTSQRLNIKRVR